MKQIEKVFNGAPGSNGCVASGNGTRATLCSLPNGSTGKSNLRVITKPAGDQFNWDTTSETTDPIKTGKGCYTVVIKLVDDYPWLSTPVLLQ